jgi:8-oxo-dGTP diphosphatase
MPKPVTPLIAVDIIIELVDRPDRPILLIERKNPPPGWALPGGFVDLGETLEQAARREAQEEISLAVRLKALLGCYSDPATGEPKAADDAAHVQAFLPEQLPAPLAFDHGRILADYLHFRRHGRLTPLR